MEENPGEVTTCDVDPAHSTDIHCIVGGPTYERMYLCGSCLHTAQTQFQGTPWQNLPIWEQLWQKIQERRVDPEVPNMEPDPDPNPVRFSILGPR